MDAVPDGAASIRFPGPWTCCGRAQRSRASPCSSSPGRGDRVGASGRGGTRHRRRSHALDRRPPRLVVGPGLAPVRRRRLRRRSGAAGHSADDVRPWDRPVRRTDPVRDHHGLPTPHAWVADGGRVDFIVSRRSVGTVSLCSSRRCRSRGPCGRRTRPPPRRAQPAPPPPTDGRPTSGAPP